MGDLFEIGTGSLLPADEQIKGDVPRISVKTTDNGVLGSYNTAENQKARHFENVISVNFFGKAYYHPYKASFDMKVHTLKILNHPFNKETGLYFTSLINHRFAGQYSYGSQLSSSKLKNENFRIKVPVHTDGEIAFDYMETYIKELEAERIKELEAERIKELEAYLVATGLNDYVLSDDEKRLIANFRNWGGAWYSFNVKDLFGKSVRGKRLKSSDRIIGKLPFVTAGETDQGISAFVGNNVQIFKRNTTTIDMFGSAKYRNYEYGGDDHIAVVNTESLPKYASLFVTATLNKSAHTGKFDYSRNFYAKDADELQIMLPITTHQKPDYELMSRYIRAIEKLVIKGVVEWKDKQIKATKKVVSKNNVD
ncbi:restriction endonuclease subunit S [Leuconostoc suionicum]|uniref:restriction endonuclease subunit S n=1 Tax=Leuconostoc suionicum TaxID=1511761 RepID=UPI0024ACCD6D|nr:restriction endonuclease subunit S [Leuconostoc suionicum]MDI6614101.1 restriction endonuclease subunit S [Leuconostoc suionicum]